jgi:hypothetical protein
MNYRPVANIVLAFIVCSWIMVVILPDCKEETPVHGPRVGENFIQGIMNVEPVQIRFTDAPYQIYKKLKFFFF